MRTQRTDASRLMHLIAGGFVAAFMMVPTAATASIHEIVAAFCSGGGKGGIGTNGHLEAPGVSDPAKHNFAQPVNASQSAIVISEDPLIVVISDSKAAKYPPGTTVVDLGTFTFLLASQSNHAAAIHCKNFSGLP